MHSAPVPTLLVSFPSSGVEAYLLMVVGLPQAWCAGSTLRPQVQQIHQENHREHAYRSRIYYVQDLRAKVCFQQAGSA